VRALEALADPVRAQGAFRYFKRYEVITPYGVRAADVRRLARTLAREVRGRWTAQDAIAFCDAMLARPQLEAKLVGMLVLERFVAGCPATLLTRVRGWVLAGRCANWALVDTLCPAVVVPLVRRHPSLSRRLRAWASSPNLWLRRVSVVWLLPFAGRGERLRESYAVVATLRGDREDLIHKACGWLLRECGRTDAVRLRDFLVAQGPRLPRTTVRYAIEHFPPAARRRLLVATRG
jgi:3-methyladenine DNA glycosylase AlkD